MQHLLHGHHTIREKRSHALSEVAPKLCTFFLHFYHCVLHVEMVERGLFVLRRAIAAECGVWAAEAQHSAKRHEPLQIPQPIHYRVSSPWAFLSFIRLEPLFHPLSFDLISQPLPAPFCPSPNHGSQ